MIEVPVEKRRGQLSRRNIMKRLAAVTGGMTFSAPVMNAIVTGFSPALAVDTVGVLTKTQLDMLSHIANMIIPDTDTPGAVAAGVPDYINVMLSEWYEAAERKKFLDGLQDVDRRARAACGSNFLSCTTEQQTKILQVLDRQAYGGGSRKTFFSQLKEMTVVGYYSSEIGADEELRYEAIPGPWRGCIPFSEVGRTWAT